MKRMLQGLMVALLLAAVGGAAQAQSERESRLRMVRGTVLDKDEVPVPEAVVYLKNLKNDTIRTTIAGNDGTYRFSGLDPNVDYEVHAEHKDGASAARKVSSFDSRREIVLHLKINKRKE